MYFNLERVRLTKLNDILEKSLISQIFILYNFENKIPS